VKIVRSSNKFQGKVISQLYVEIVTKNLRYELVKIISPENLVHC
jgi:hypothetical protein